MIYFIRILINIMGLCLAFYTLMKYIYKYQAKSHDNYSLLFPIHKLPTNQAPSTRKPSAKRRHQNQITFFEHSFLIHLI